MTFFILSDFFFFISLQNVLLGVAFTVRKKIKAVENGLIKQSFAPLWLSLILLSSFWFSFSFLYSFSSGIYSFSFFYFVFR